MAPIILRNNLVFSSRFPKAVMVALLLSACSIVPSHAAQDRIFAISTHEMSPNVKVSILNSNLIALNSNNKNCKKLQTFHLYVEPQNGSIASHINLMVRSPGISLFDMGRKTYQGSSHLTYRTHCAAAFWKASTFDFSLSLTIQQGQGGIQYSNVNYRISKIIAPNRPLPIIKTTEVTPSSKSATLLTSSDELLSDPPFTYEYKIVSPSNEASTWKAVRGPVIGLTKLKSKTKYKIAVRAVSFDKVFGKTVFKQFSTK